MTSLTRNASIIKQVYFPREIFAITAVASQLVMASLSLLIAIPYMVYFQIAPTPSLVMVPLGVALTGTLALGVGLAMACLNVANRDVQHSFVFLTRVGLYLSPVLWTLERAKGARAEAVDYLLLNPMAVPITMIRNGITGAPLGVDSFYVAYSVGFCLLSFAIGASVFKRLEATAVKKL